MDRVGAVSDYRYGAKVVGLGPSDTLLFDATTLHGIESIDEQPVAYLSVVFTLRDSRRRPRLPEK